MVTENGVETFHSTMVYFNLKSIIFGFTNLASRENENLAITDKDWNFAVLLESSVISSKCQTPSVSRHGWSPAPLQWKVLLKGTHSVYFVVRIKNVLVTVDDATCF